MKFIAKYISINLKSDTVIFDYKEKLDDIEKSILNSNVLYEGSFLYEYKYYKRNKNIIGNNVNLVLKRNNITILKINNIEIVNLVLDFIRVVTIDSIIFAFSSSLPKEIFERLLLIKNIKYIDVYYMPDFMIRKFQNKRIKVDLNYKKTISDEFMLNHDAIDYEALYYKKSINIKKFNTSFVSDFREFLKVNYNLKIIHIYLFDKNIIETVIRILREEYIERVVILLQQKFDKDMFISKNFIWLKEINNKYKEETNGEIRIIYSEHFIKNNLFKQLTFNNLKLTCILIMYIAVVGIFFIEFYDYISEYNMNRLDYILSSQLEEENNSNIEGSNIGSTTDGSKTEEPKYNFEKNYSILTNINKDTVGWLSVNGTKINYPVVKYKNNDYYLKRDFYKAKASSGWIFMDYRNDKSIKDLNTIIYGHRMNNETMFGSMHKILNKNWYKNNENLVVSFDIPNKEMNWQVFSVYKVNVTSDYLQTTFPNESSFNDFVNLITKRSVYNFKVDVKYGDKILTLSTCVAGSKNQRLVLHAKLIK